MKAVFFYFMLALDSGHERRFCKQKMTLLSLSLHSDLACRLTRRRSLVASSSPVLQLMRWMLSSHSDSLNPKTMNRERHCRSSGSDPPLQVVRL